MNIKEHLPPYLQDIREFNTICSIENEELERLQKQLREILNETIVKTANSYGLKRYEKIYNIKPSSNNIEERRFNILSKINNRVPYTLNWLRNKLEALVGKDNYRIDVDYNNYKITIDVAMIFENIANILNIDLREQLPANLIITVNLFQTEESKIYTGAILHEGEFIRIGVI